MIFIGTKNYRDRRIRQTSAWRRVLPLVGILTLMLASCGTDEDAATGEDDDSTEVDDSDGVDDDGGDVEAITLTVADSRGTEHYMVENGILPWMDRVTELTDGQVEFDFFPAEQLGSLSDHLSLLRQGTADIVYLPPAFFGGEMPLSEIHSLPGLWDDSAEASRVFSEASNDSPIAEIDYEANGAYHLWGTMTVPYNVFTSDRPVESVDDLQGLSLRSGGGYQAATLDALGATGVTVPSPEAYQAVQTGTVDGVVFPSSSLAEYSIDEVVDYGTLGFNLTSFYAPYAISLDVWDGLSDSVKEAFETANAEYEELIGNMTDDLGESALDDFEEGGMQLLELPADEQEELQAVFEEIFDTWMADAEEDGLPADETLAYLMERTS